MKTSKRRQYTDRITYVSYNITVWLIICCLKVCKDLDSITFLGRWFHWLIVDGKMNVIETIKDQVQKTHNEAVAT